MYGPPPPYKRDQRDGVTVCANVFGLDVGLQTPRAMMEFARARPQKIHGLRGRIFGQVLGHAAWAVLPSC